MLRQNQGVAASLVGLVIWLVVWNMNFMTFHIVGMSWSQLTNSIIFQRGRYTTNQLCELPHKYLKGSKSMAFPAFSQHVQTLSRGQEWGLICYKQAPSAPWAVKMRFQREKGNWYHRENINCIRWYWHVDFCQFSIFVGILSFHTIMQYTGCV